MKLVALTESDGWMVSDLQRAAAQLDVRLQIARWRDLSASGDSVRAGDVTLHDAHVVLLRQMGGGSLEQIVFRMDVLHRLAARGVTVVNDPRSIEIAVDKYLSTALLTAAGLPVPQTIVCQRPGDAMAAFDELGGDVVIKPLFGAEGRGMTRVTDRDHGQRVFDQLHEQDSIIYLQRFVEAEDGDLRLFVLGDRVLAAMRRRGAEDFRSNMAQGAHAEVIKPDRQCAQMALHAAKVCRARIAGVDIMIDTEGRPFVLEVNAVPGWKHLAKTTGVDVAEQVLCFVSRLADTRSAHAPMR